MLSVLPAYSEAFDLLRPATVDSRCSVDYPDGVVNVNFKPARQWTAGFRNATYITGRSGRPLGK